MERETGTTARVLMVLRAIAQAQGEPTMKELSDQLNLPLSTMHRLLEMLAEEGMVERDDLTRAFRPGPDFFRMAAMVVNRMPIRTVARPFLAAAMRAADESAYLCLLDAGSGRMTFAATTPCSHMLDYRVPLDTPFSLVVGASGLSILAWLDDVHRAEIVRAETTAGGVLDRAALARLPEALKQIRADGYAQTFGQRIKGAVGIFAPVFDASSAVCGSFGFTVPEVRYQPAMQKKLASAAVQQALALSRALGYPGEQAQAVAVRRPGGRRA